MTGKLTPLTCVRVVCQNGPEILRLSHVIAELERFLDNSKKWTLHKACASDSPYLVARLLQRQEDRASTSFWNHPDYRQLQFDKSLREATNVGNLDIVQLLTTFYRECHVSRAVIENAAGRGRAEIIAWLVQSVCDIHWDPWVVYEAIINGHFMLTKWLKDRLPHLSVDTMSRWAEIAASKGNLAMVKWVCDLLTERDSNGRLRYLSKNVNLWRAVQSATNKGELHVLKWFMDEPNRKVLLYELLGQEIEGTSVHGIDMCRAADNGHIGVLKWLIQCYPEMVNTRDADIFAASSGHLSILRLLRSSPIEQSTSLDAVMTAARNGHLDIVKYLVSEGYSVVYAMDNAATSGYLDIVKWLDENTAQESNTCTADAMNGAALHGHLDVVKWLHDNRNEGCTVKAMDGAATYGHFRVVQWLHENRIEGCTTHAMDEAASAGNLEMVKWLHFNRREGCTTDAMDYAAGNGYLDVVKWLHVNRLEGCTTDAMDFAAKTNHLEVMKWLDQNRTEGFTAKANRNSVQLCNLDVVQWLLSRGAEIPLSAAFRAAAAGCHFDVLWILYLKYGSIKTLTEAITTTFRRLEFTEWAYVHHRKEFKVNIAECLFPK